MEYAEDPEFCSMIDRLRDEIGNGTGELPAAFGRLAETGDPAELPRDPEELHRLLTEPGRPLWAREIAAYALGVAGDPRAFEALVLLLNHRDPERCVTAAHALVRLGDPAPPARPPPSPPTNSGPPTPCCPSGCSPDCVPPSPYRP